MKQDATVVQRIPVFQARLEIFISGLVTNLPYRRHQSDPPFPLDDPPLIDTHHLVKLDRHDARTATVQGALRLHLLCIQKQDKVLILPAGYFFVGACKTNSTLLMNVWG